MTLRLHDTLSRETRPFRPRDPARVGVYCCGPTVYDLPHAGHARAALLPDLLVRRLRALGFPVKYVRNVTDVDDKILARARERGETPPELAERMTVAYQEAMARLGCLPPDVEPRVSGTIPGIVALIERLVERGVAYVQPMPGGTTDVYFSVRSFPEYGKLSRRRVDELRVGARVERDDTKRDPLDFALWKGEPPGAWGWESPWGFGRPGWHIECSAMSTEHLGHGFDVHTGGMDLIFPHHENEIAQSEGARPDAGPYCGFWLHNGFVNVDKEKMSKSLGNFVTIADVFERNDPEAFRWFLLSAHYRGPLQFETEVSPSGRVVFPGVDAAERQVDYVYATVARLERLGADGATVPARTPPELAALRTAVGGAVRAAEAALDDDLDTPGALASVHELARLGNELADLAEKRRKDPSFQAAAGVLGAGLLQGLRRVTEQLGLLASTTSDYAARTRAQRLRLLGLTEGEIDAKVEERSRARRERDFARGDALREELAALGVTLSDGPSGTTWTLSR